MEPKPPADETPGQMLGKLSATSSALTGPIIVGLLLDWQLGWSPWGVLVGLAVGFFGCMAFLVQQAKRK